MGSSGKAVTVGYKYNVGMHMVLCHGPVDKITRISVDNRPAWLGSRDGGSIAINKPDMFGGDAREGGIVGTVDFETGHAGQGQNSYLVSKLGDLVPAFRGVVGVVLRQMYMGLNPYLKPWSFRLQRIHKRQNGLLQWYDKKSEIKIAGSFKESQSFFFAVDCSRSMDTIVSGSLTRLDIVKQQLTEILDTINSLRLDITVPVDIAICAWGESGYDIWRRNVTGSIINDLKNFVNNISSTSGTDFRIPARSALNWFEDTASDNKRRTFLLITDGEPDSGSESPMQIAEEARSIISGFLDRTSLDVDCYAINIDLENTTYTQLMDNTASDSIPVVSSSDSSALYNAVFFALLGDSSSMNPAHIIRECLTDPLWGMGYLDSDIDDVSFRAAADAMYAESMGISIVWDTQTSIEEFVKLIARHIDATLYVDRVTGRFVLKLIRDDYDENGLIVLDENNIDTITDFVRPSFGELTNSVTVTYWSAVIGDKSTLTVQDIALAQQQGATINTSINYEGFSDSITASKAAQRDLRALSTPMASCTIITNEVAKNLNIGSVFKLSWNDYDIENMVMRVTSIAFGDGKTNRIRITCAQDVFATPSEAYIVTPPPQWEDPTQEPTAAATRYAFEVPYLELVQQQGQSAVDAALSSNPDAGYVAAGAARPSSGMVSARLYTNNGSGYEDVSSLDFGPGAKLAEDINRTVKTFAVSNFVDMASLQVGSWFQIGEELMSVESFTMNSLTVKRAVLDTVPVAHIAGETLLFWDAYSENDPTEYISSDVVSVKILTNSGSGQLALSAAPEDVVTLRSRAIRPYPPGNLKVNGEYFPTAELTGNIELSWVGRNRLQQTGGTLIGFDDGAVTSEVGVKYNVRLFDGASLVSEWTDIETTSLVILESVFENNSTKPFRFEVESKREGYESYYFHSFNVLIKGKQVLLAPVSLSSGVKSVIPHFVGSSTS